MTSAAMERAVIEAECRAFCRHVADVEPTAYVLEHYGRLHPTANASPQASDEVIERALLAMSRWGALPLRLADGYARFFRPRSLLRRRLVLMLAILENSPPSERRLNSGEEGSLAGVGLHLLATLVVGGTCIVLGTLLLGPVHLFGRAFSSRAAGAQA